MKKFMACALSVCMVAATLVGCDGNNNGGAVVDNGGNGGDGAVVVDNNNNGGDGDGAASGKTVINLWAFTDEIPKMVDYYVSSHPDFAAKYDVKSTIVATDGGAYQTAIDQALVAGGADAPDIYAAEAAFVLKYTQGDMAQYAAAYDDLGIDSANAIKEAQIASYTIDLGTNGDGKLVALGYQATGGAFIYRRSVAEATWGASDPDTVKAKIGGGSGNWDQFWVAADELKAKGFGIVSGDGDMWHAIENSSDQGWIVDGKLHIDPKREAFFDVSKKLKDNGYHNDTQDWQDGWFADMKGEGEKDVLGFFGPAWLINYTIAANCGGNAKGEGTFGDWGVCESPIGFFWGGTWVIGSKYAVENGKADGVAEIIYWITLDSTKDGLQYAWANGTVDWDNDPETATSKDCVGSNTVLGISDGSIDFLDGQNMFDIFVPANSAANGKNLTQYDEKINTLFRDQVREYSAGNKSKEDAIAAFKQNVADELMIEAE